MVNSERLELRVSPSFLKRLDAWRRMQEDLPSRAEAIRRICDDKIEADFLAEIPEHIRNAAQ